MSQSNLAMWQIMVPTTMNRLVNGLTELRPCSVRYHRVWDAKVKEITGGLTICPVSTGIWVSPSGADFRERMIPVNIAATREQIEKIMDFTMTYYNQEAVLCYKLSEEVIFKYKGENLNPAARYDENYGDDRLCYCGHTYIRHFDPYEDYEAVGCKYCHEACNGFREATEEDYNKAKKTAADFFMEGVYHGIERLPDELEWSASQLVQAWGRKRSEEILDK